jgi:hypothetical protein
VINVADSRWVFATYKLNLKIIAPIFVALLMSTIWILSSKNNTGETKLTNNYQAEQIIRHDKS